MTKSTETRSKEWRFRAACDSKRASSWTLTVLTVGASSRAEAAKGRAASLGAFEACGLRGASGIAEGTR